MTNITMSVLLTAMMTVESGNNPLAHNVEADAVGVLQIRPIMVADVNRICSDRGWIGTFTLNDRWSVAASCRMAEIYFAYYCKGLDPLDMARCWNGGPTGYRKESTLPYAERVRVEINKLFKVEHYEN